jgi:hypothetical protein
MSTNKSFQRYPRKSKAHTDYPVSLAFSRINFYLDVLEAHFNALGVELNRRKKEQEESRESSRAAEGG